MFRLFRKKYYKQVECKNCKGEGQLTVKIYRSINDKETTQVNYIGPCDCCNGRGTQTVLEREE